MILIAVVIGLLTAITQYLKYKKTARSFWTKKLMAPVIIALIIAVLVSVFGGITYDKYGIGYLGAIHLALFSAIFAVVANATYIWSGLKGKLLSAGGSVAHVGFGMVLTAILITSSKREVISINRTGIMIPGLKDPKAETIAGWRMLPLLWVFLRQWVNTWLLMRAIQHVPTMKNYTSRLIIHVKTLLREKLKSISIYIPMLSW